MKKIILSFLLFSSALSFSQKLEIIPLGIYGGGDESNLSSYLIGVENSNSYLALDAGTIHSGINKAIAEKTFNVDNSTVLKEYIKGYFISHGHLDHLSGLIINSPEDSSKPIYALPFVIDIFKNNYFTNASWSNFANEGEKPIIGKYKYTRVKPSQSFSIENTSLSAEVFELSHVNPQLSSAILVKNNDEYVLYFGDTGADRVEKTTKLNYIWGYISPLIINKNLKTILIEVSFPNSQAENKLYGHLTPKLLNEELGNLAAYVGADKLKDLNIIVTHLKPSGTAIETIKKELADNNLYQVNFIFPIQGQKVNLKQ
ncbi:MBL fold metallo-hydrolase [Myroides marinus]|uniref:MBL fold metallo-hydrolase n=1 Tax=Myroides marinus TaxID=703342 RepID=UPI002576AC48|nr:3',5'-cyclic-nucleotide phosphodiesterase [Myroides marinus]MDM1532481.1 3',5'-cyclic-nucleotide phosphodiesterase [Myroides marinus]MDM1539443.1 3',5'-cyclic-nucleotide phosphodiesterase [Myroides marinus]